MIMFQKTKKKKYDKLLKSFKYTKIRGTGLKKNRGGRR